MTFSYKVPSRIMFKALPLKSCRKEACVPVVPFTPRNLRSSRALRMARSSINRSWSQRVALFPTVVNWAGWRWVKPRVGSERYSFANFASLERTPASFGRRRLKPSRKTIRSFGKKLQLIISKILSFAIQLPLQFEID